MYNKLETYESPELKARLIVGVYHTSAGMDSPAVSHYCSAQNKNTIICGTEEKKKAH